MPSRNMKCKRVFRSSDGTFRACDGPLVFALVTGTWTCAWCGRELPRLWPRL